MSSAKDEKIMNLLTAQDYPASGSLAKNSSPPTTVVSSAKEEKIMNLLTAQDYPASGSLPKNSSPPTTVL